MNNIEIDFGNDGFKINAELQADERGWFLGIGRWPQGIHVFSETPAKAIADFKSEFRNYTATR